jgi:hypothetical protein
VLLVAMLLLVVGAQSHRPPWRHEARLNVRKLFDAAVTYYETPHPGPDGRALPPQFPRSVALTPAVWPCREEEGTHAPAPKEWSDSTWQALGFAMNEPHAYRYEFVSEGARFTARALGDLDCDGVLATFERVGFLDEHGQVTGGVGLFTVNELE